jgi:hypothetical protein
LAGLSAPALAFPGIDEEFFLPGKRCLPLSRRTRKNSVQFSVISFQLDHVVLSSLDHVRALRGRLKTDY